MTNHPKRIIETLDRHLSRRTSLILYGRAALALGFPDPDPGFFATFDVDAILPRANMEAIENDDQFWNGLEKTNIELESEDLYITHLFADDQVILSVDWMAKLVALDMEGLRHLSLFRPSTEDLILTKMMRVDPQDREDIRYLMGQVVSLPGSLEDCLAAAVVPPIPEIQEAYAVNRRWIEEEFLG